MCIQKRKSNSLSQLNHGFQLGHGKVQMSYCLSSSLQPLKCSLFSFLKYWTKQSEQTLLYYLSYIQQYVVIYDITNISFNCSFCCPYFMCISVQYVCMAQPNTMSNYLDSASRDLWLTQWQLLVSHVRGQEIEPPKQGEKVYFTFSSNFTVVSGGMSSSYPLRAMVIGSRDAGHRSGF